MREVVYSLCDESLNTLEEKYTRTSNNEREVGDIKHKILLDSSTGLFHPIDREEIIRLVLTADDIAENAKSGAKNLHIASTDILTDEIKSALVSIIYYETFLMFVLSVKRGSR